MKFYGSITLLKIRAKNYGSENVGDGIKIIEIKEKVNSNENKKEVLKNLNAKISINNTLVPIMSENKLIAINKIGLKPNIDAKIEKNRRKRQKHGNRKNHIIKCFN